MSRNALPISALLLLACNGVPSRPLPGDYQPQALTIRAHFQDLPADATGAGLLVYWVNRYDRSLDQVPTDSSAELSTDEVEFHVPATATPIAAEYAPRDLRFFRVLAHVVHPLDQDQGSTFYPGSWEEPGRLLVYATHATFWTPLGPGSPTLNFPAGYSWLRRRCGASPGQVEMEVHPIDEVIELSHQVGTDAEMPDLETSERALVEGCGAPIPAADVGTRVSFDVASAMAWSPDGTTIYYLSTADEQDKTQTVGLRQVRLLDSATSELTTIARATNVRVQAGKPGHVFVSTWDTLFHVTLAPTIAVVPLLNLGGRTAVVSPDGQWLAYHDERTRIIDLDTGMPLAGFDGPRGSPYGWSNDGRLAYWSFDGPQTSLNTLSLAAPSDVPRTYPIAQGTRTDVVWTSGGVMLTKTPLDPSWIEEESTVYVGDFGLTLVDPTTGLELPLIDATAGMVWPAQGTAVIDKGFAWTKKCLGPWLTVCSSTLVRINAAQATVEPIATWSSPVPMALSSDGRRLALGTSKGIYIKDLPQ